jgi:hypothetical protein
MPVAPGAFSALLPTAEMTDASGVPLPLPAGPDTFADELSPAAADDRSTTFQRATGQMSGSVSLRKSWSRRALAMGVGGVAAAALLIALFAGGDGAGESSEPPVSTSGVGSLPIDAPIAAPEPTSPSPEPPPPSATRITVEQAPPRTRIVVDGRAVQGTTTEVAKDGRVHRVEISARGYHSESFTVDDSSPPQRVLLRKKARRPQRRSPAKTKPRKPPPPLVP